MCICVYVYVCMCVWVYLCICVYEYICISVYVYSMCICICMYVYTCTSSVHMFLTGAEAQMVDAISVGEPKSKPRLVTVPHSKYKKFMFVFSSWVASQIWRQASPARFVAPHVRVSLQTRMVPVALAGVAAEQRRDPCETHYRPVRFRVCGSRCQTT